MTLRRAGAAIGLVSMAAAFAASPARGAPPAPQGPFGGGVRFEQPIPDLPEAQRAAILETVRRNVAELLAEGRLALPEGGPVLFDWPLRPANGLTDPGYHGTSPYVDHDGTTGLRDFACVQDTYDGHRGTDIILWPFPWRKVLGSKVEVVAAAPGTLVFRQDGHSDQNCTWAGQEGNGVTLLHADGSSSIYWHMKNGSVTPKTVGAAIAAGEYLGVVASSGVSTWPHLHFEVWDGSGQTVDPFAGACNATTLESRWVAQRPHLDTAINKLTTGYAAPSALPPCPTLEEPNEGKDFNPGSGVYFTAYYRDLRYNQPTSFEVRRPDGSLFSSWVFTVTPPNPVYDVSFYWWSLFIPTGSPSGTWSWRATFEGVLYEQLFNVGTASAGRVPSVAVDGPPLTVAKTPAGGLRLSWGDSCKSSDSDFSVYEGTLGTFYSHKRKVCSTSGEKAWTFPSPPPASVYWIVVPKNLTRGGSFGTDSHSVERPEPSAFDRCAVREFQCP